MPGAGITIPYYPAAYTRNSFAVGHGGGGFNNFSYCNACHHA